MDFTLFRLLDATANTGITLTESLAMHPGSSVSSPYSASHAAKYLAVGKLERDQVEAYAARKGQSVAEAEKWLAPYLNYDPDSLLLPMREPPSSDRAEKYPRRFKIWKWISKGLGRRNLPACQFFP